MNTKKEYRYFSIFNHQDEEKYLSENHKSGWRFVKVTGFGIYHFEECKPEDMVYQLDYNPQTKDTIEEYKRLFADCGWEYVQEYAGYSYFRKPASEMNGNEEIFNDDPSRTAMLGRVYKDRLTPLFVIFFACLLPQFILNLVNQRYVISSFIGGILLIYVVIFIVCAVCYGITKNK